MISTWNQGKEKAEVHVNGTFTVTIVDLGRYVIEASSEDTVESLADKAYKRAFNGQDISVPDLDLVRVHYMNSGGEIELEVANQPSMD